MGRRRWGHPSLQSAGSSGQREVREGVEGEGEVGGREVAEQFEGVGWVWLTLGVVGEVGRLRRWLLCRGDGGRCPDLRLVRVVGEGRLRVAVVATTRMRRRRLHGRRRRGGGGGGGERRRASQAAPYREGPSDDYEGSGSQVCAQLLCAGEGAMEVETARSCASCPSDSGGGSRAESESESRLRSVSPVKRVVMSSSRGGGEHS